MIDYLTVCGETENVTVIERSKFICYIKGIKDECEAKDFVSFIRKKNSLATHNCYAYIADSEGLIQKFSDDGEPQGTAGMPMLDVLKNKNLKKTVAVVTRFFGGIKLGTGGLVRAYSGAVSDCLKKCSLCKMFLSDYYSFDVDYSDYPKALKLIDGENSVVMKTDFADLVSVKVAVKKESVKPFLFSFSETFCGSVNLIKEGEEYFAFNYAEDN